MSLFSIIVPVYNVEDYLPECIESILVQPFTDYELLLINDGSTDKSGEICERYSVVSDRIRVFHKPHSGLSDTRNLGIDNSRGKYLIFIDSDDYILPDVLNEFGKILKTNDTADILITKMAEQYPNKDMCFMDERYKIEEFENNSKVQIIDWVFNRSQNTWPVVRYIVKSKFVIDNQIRFITGRLHEDLDWTSKLFLHATKFSFSDTYWYVHRIERPGSITTSKKAKNVLDVIDIVQMNIEDRAYDRLGDINKEVIFARLTRSLYCILCHYNHFDEQGKQEIKNRLIDSREVLRYTTRVKHKMFLYFSKIFGVGLGLHILGKIKGT